MTWQNPRILLILLLVFVTGATAGALAARGLRPAKKPITYWQEGGKEISLERFRRELDLNPDQTEKMRVVLDDFVMYYQTLQEQMNEVRANGKSRILQILEDDQKQKFLKMVNDLQSKQIK